MRKIKRFLFMVILLGAVGAGAYFYFYKDIPSYKESRNLKLLTFTKDKISASVDVVCHNPNRLGLKLAGCDINVTANGKEACNVKQKFSTDIKPSSDFTVPLTISFSPAKIFKPVDLLAGAFQSLRSKSVKLRYTGTVQVGLAGVNTDIPVDFEEDLPLKGE